MTKVILPYILSLMLSLSATAQTKRALVIGLGQQEDKEWNKINGDKDVPYVLGYLKKAGRSLNFPWQAPEVLTKDGAYTIQEERDVRNAMQLCSESFDL